MINLAKYDRRLLLPYLQDICSIEFLICRLMKERETAHRNMCWFKDKLDQDKPPRKVADHSLDIMRSFRKKGNIYATCACLGIVLGSSMGGSLGSAGMALEAMIVVLVILSGWNYLHAWDEYNVWCQYESMEDDYKEAFAAYEVREPIRQQHKENMNAWLHHVNVLDGRIQEVKALREQAYGVNVIPIQYRNIYAVHYLYDFFRSGQSDDLDQVLQIFVLEEIKARLDKIIEQQTEMIINQRIMIAQQEKTNTMIAKNHEKEMRQLANINQNAERRNQYLEMINCNLAISNYFAYQEYIHRGN